MKPGWGTNTAAHKNGYCGLCGSSGSDGVLGISFSASY